MELASPHWVGSTRCRGAGSSRTELYKHQSAHLLLMTLTVNQPEQLTPGPSAHLNGERTSLARCVQDVTHLPPLLRSGGGLGAAAFAPVLAAGLAAGLAAVFASAFAFAPAKGIFKHPTPLPPGSVRGDGLLRRRVLSISWPRCSVLSPEPADMHRARKQPGSSS